MLSRAQVIFIFPLLFVYSLEHEQPTVETSLGTIRGHYKHTYSNRTFSAFEGIPYAKPPLGNLRFSEPLSIIEPWSGIWDATVIHECMQLHWVTQEAIGSEDCLYLNVYVPKNQVVPNENLDVIVHIHGGAFMVGTPEMGGPEYLMDRNIVYVNLNYRLGVLGFLSTEDEVVSGNNGMKDQVMALKWVQSHIEQFGGNPNSVTIIGLSAGGAAVHLHYFSALSKGLFHRGISQSGTALAPWAIKEAPLESARRLGASLGCNDPSTKDLVKCLRQRSAKQVIKIPSTILHGFPIALFAPVIEKKSEGAFLVDYPYKLLENKNITDVPWITSITTEEGILGVMVLNKNFDDLNKHWTEALADVLDYNDTVANSGKAVIAEKIKQFYLGGEEVSQDNIQKFIKLFGDRYFNLDNEKSARMHAKVSKSSTYSYVYGYRGDHKFIVDFLKENYGVCHGEDGNLLYQVKMGEYLFKKEKLSENDERIKEMLLDIVTSFAKNGKPEVEGVTWEPVQHSRDFGFLFINNDGAKMVYEKELAPTEFWKSLPINENENIALAKDEL